MTKVSSYKNNFCQYHCMLKMNSCFLNNKFLPEGANNFGADCILVKKCFIT